MVCWGKNRFNDSIYPDSHHPTGIDPDSHPDVDADLDHYPYENPDANQYPVPTARYANRGAHRQPQCGYIKKCQPTVRYDAVRV